MTPQRWLWPLVAAVVGAILLVDTARNGRWPMLAGMLVISAPFYGVYRLAIHRGFEWKLQRGFGLVAVPAMFIGLLVGIQVSESIYVGSLVGFASAWVALLVAGLRRAR